MSYEIMLSQILKDIGAISNRLENIETVVYSNISMDDDSPEDLPNKFTYPITTDIKDDNIATTDQFRFLKHTMYKVQIAKPHMEEFPPVIIDVKMTRDELDEFIARNPATSHEFIVSIIPEYHDHL
jgi:hypothetical protein